MYHCLVAENANHIINNFAFHQFKMFGFLSLPHIENENENKKSKIKENEIIE